MIDVGLKVLSNDVIDVGYLGRNIMIMVVVVVVVLFTLRTSCFGISIQAVKTAVCPVRRKRIVLGILFWVFSNPVIELQ